jgi:hypothetical protein
MKKKELKPLKRYCKNCNHGFNISKSYEFNQKYICLLRNKDILNCPITNESGCNYSQNKLSKLSIKFVKKFVKRTNKIKLEPIIISNCCENIVLTKKQKHNLEKDIYDLFKEEY